MFVLEMGKPVKIIDLARRMIELSGLSVRDEMRPDGDIDIEVSGLRPGEKLFEELLIGDDPKPTSHPRIMKAQDDFVSWPQLENELAALEMALTGHDVPQIRDLMGKLVSGYNPTSAIVDWVHLEQEAAASAAR